MAGDRGIPRRAFLQLGVLGGAIAAAPRAVVAAAPKSFELDELTITQLQAGLTSGKLSSVQLVRAYLERADEIDRDGPRLRSILERNPDAIAIAETLDRERKTRGARGALHGIPILVKDNLDTADRMTTTAGSLALEGTIAARDSFVVERLRAAGAIVLGKTNLSEWANIRSSRSSSGWSGRGGQTRNPYALDRSPCGSSSGSAAAVAANLAAAAIGTETDGSITCPSSCCALAGLKPTVGLVSRAGIIPISPSQDTAGPMARSVSDLAILLNAIAGADPRDPATSAAADRARIDYTRFLNGNGLRGARIGVSRKQFGASERGDKLIEAALDDLRRLGATVIDPADVETIGKFDEAELDVLLYELKASLNEYLAASKARVRSLADVIAFNEMHADRELAFFGQDLFVKAQAKGPLTSPEYVKARELCVRLSRKEGLDATMDQHQLDAIVAPTLGPPGPIDLVIGDHFVGGATTPAAVAGYPHVTVPAGFVFGLPVGLSFVGRAFSEPRLFELAFAYELATRHRKTPRFLKTVELPI